MVRYGGNTSCVQVEPSEGSQIIFDCGTGSRSLGRELVSRTEHRPNHVHLLTTHLHWDHIQGFPFFAPVYAPGIEVSVYGPSGLDLGLESALAGQMQHTYFPVHLSALGSRIHARELGEGAFTIGAVRVRAQYLNHTAPTLGYRVEAGGVSVVYATDHEPFWWSPSHPSKLPDMQHPGDRRHISFLEGADVVIHDSQYSDQQYPDRRGWGHSPIEFVVDSAVIAGVKRLVLFHHDPDRTDAELNRVLARARRQAARKSGGKLEVLAASEGLVITLPESDAPTPALEADQRLKRTGTGRRVVVCATDPNELVTLSEALSPDGHLVRPVSDPVTLLTVIGGEAADLVLVAVHSVEQRPENVIDAIRRVRGVDDLPVILITDGLPTETAEQLLQMGTDVLYRPWGAPMLRARVRAWLARYPDQRTTQNGGTNGADSPRVDRRAARRQMKSDIFSGTLDDRRALQAGAVQRTFSSGDVLFREGDPSDGTYVLLEGTVRVLVRSRDGRDIPLGAAGPGDTMGELGALDAGPRSATAIAETNVTALFVRRQAFIDLLRSSSDQALRFMRVLAARLRSADRQLVDMASATLYTRVAKRLLELKDERPAPIQVSVEELAEQIAAAPAEVEITMTGLEKLGAIRRFEGEVEITSPHILRTLLTS